MLKGFKATALLCVTGLHENKFLDEHSLAFWKRSGQTVESSGKEDVFLVKTKARLSLPTDLLPKDCALPLGRALLGKKTVINFLEWL